MGFLVEFTSGYYTSFEVKKGEVKFFPKTTDFWNAQIANPRLKCARFTFSRGWAHLATLIEAGDAHTNQSLEWLTWHGWVQSHELKKLEPKRWMYFDFAHQMAQAALTGQGIALLRMPLIAENLAQGELVEVFPDFRVDSPMSYWLAIAERSKVRPEINALSSWLLEQARLTRLTMGDKS